MLNGVPSVFTPRDMTWIFIWFTVCSTLLFDAFMWIVYGADATITRVLLDRGKNNPVPLVLGWLFIGHMIYSFYRR